jgi:hypothetical protein
MSSEIEEPFKTKADSLWFKSQLKNDKPNINQANEPHESSPGFMYADSRVLQDEVRRRALYRWLQAHPPEIMLFVVRAYMEKIQRDEWRKHNAIWMRLGGWKGIFRDLKRAEKAILEVYGLDE